MNACRKARAEFLIHIIVDMDGCKRNEESNILFINRIRSCKVGRAVVSANYGKKNTAMRDPAAAR